jgi:hypothetical protein
MPLAPRAAAGYSRQVEKLRQTTGLFQVVKNVDEKK